VHTGGVSDDDRTSLIHNLDWVAKRLLRRAYKQAGDLDEREHPTLARVVKVIAGEQQWRDSPNQALINVMRGAIDRLGEQMVQRKPEDKGKKTRVPLACIDSPERHLAEILYGFKDDELTARLGMEREHFTYKYDYYPAAKELAGLEEYQKSTTKRMIGVIREDLADILLDMESQEVDRQDRSNSAVKTDHEPDSDGSSFIARNEYVDAIRSHVEADQLIVCIWGEPGTGKTVMADQIVNVLVSGPVLRLRAGDPDVLRADIVEALMSEDMQPTNWSDAYCWAMLKQRISRLPELPRNRAVIIDNVDDEGLIEQLVPELPRIPVFITMRNKPRSPEFATVELHDFTEAQACVFIKNYLDNPDETETLSLARVLGCRPLALDHAVRFIQQSPDVTLRDLITELTISVTDGLNLVVDPAEKTKNLVRLYKIILASIVEDDATRHMLDTFLAIAGKSGMEERGLLYFFMESKFGGSSDRVRLRSGLRALARRGLLREDSIGREHGALLIMHPLTYEILRDLRTPVPFQIESEYLRFLMRPEVAELLHKGKFDPGKLRSGWANAWGRAQELAAVKGLDLPDGWKTIEIIDEYTWVAIREQPEEIDPGSGNIVASEYIVRYEVYPHGVYKLDYRTGERTELELDEARQLWFSAGKFHDAIVPLLQNIQQWAMGEADPDQRPD
jgi:hypothetical protein